MIDTQANLHPHVRIYQTHIIDLPSCCPVSKNPQPGSTIKISYHAKAVFLEVYSLHEYVHSYINGRGDVRSMEGMLQQIAHDCAKVLSVKVIAEALVILDCGDKMHITARCNHV